MGQKCRQVAAVELGSQIGRVLSWGPEAGSQGPGSKVGSRVKVPEDKVPSPEAGLPRRPGTGRELGPANNEKRDWSLANGGGRGTGYNFGGPVQTKNMGPCP